MTWHVMARNKTERRTKTYFFNRGKSNRNTEKHTYCLYFYIPANSTSGSCRYLARATAARWFTVNSGNSFSPLVDRAKTQATSSLTGAMSQFFHTSSSSSSSSYSSLE